MGSHSWPGALGLYCELCLVENDWPGLLFLSPSLWSLFFHTSHKEPYCIGVVTKTQGGLRIVHMEQQF